MRLSWAKLLKRVFNLDLEHCPNCGGELKITAAIRGRPGPEAPHRVSNWPDFRPDGRPRSATVVIRKDDDGVIGT